DWVQKELKVDFQSGPEYMRLSLSGDRPEEQKLLVSEVTSAYLKEIVNRDRSKNLAHLERLRDIQSKLEKTLARKRRSAREMMVAFGSTDPQALVVKQRYAYEALG